MVESIVFELAKVRTPRSAFVQGQIATRLDVSPYNVHSQYQRFEAVFDVIEQLKNEIDLLRAENEALREQKHGCIDANEFVSCPLPSKAEWRSADIKSMETARFYGLEVAFDLQSFGNDAKETVGNYKETPIG